MLTRSSDTVVTGDWRFELEGFPRSAYKPRIPIPVNFQVTLLTLWNEKMYIDELLNISNFRVTDWTNVEDVFGYEKLTLKI